MTANGSRRVWPNAQVVEKVTAALMPDLFYPYAPRQKMSRWLAQKFLKPVIGQWVKFIGVAEMKQAIRHKSLGFPCRFCAVLL